jgi:hypothetical protein
MQLFLNYANNKFLDMQGFRPFGGMYVCMCVCVCMYVCMYVCILYTIYYANNKFLDMQGFTPFGGKIGYGYYILHTQLGIVNTYVVQYCTLILSIYTVHCALILSYPSTLHPHTHTHTYTYTHTHTHTHT